MAGPLALVTGGAGFVGSHLVQALLAAGHPVRVLDLADPGDRPAGVDLVKADIRDAPAVRRACEGAVTVFHCVAMVPLARDRRAFWSVNRDGTAVLLSACRAAGVRKVVHVSSSAVFGVPPTNPVDETVAPVPGEEYGRAKMAAEELCLAEARRGLDVTILRPRTVMGPGRLGIMQVLFEWVLEGHNIPVLGPGDNLYQFIDVRDLSDACLRAAARRGPAVYNVGAERFGTMRETLEGLVRHAGTPSRVRSVPMAPAVCLMRLAGALGLSPLGAYHALMYGRSLYFDTGRARRDLDWSPRFSNVESFSDSYDWYVTHRDLVLARGGPSHHRSPVRQGILWLLRFVL